MSSSRLLPHSLELLAVVEEACIEYCRTNMGGGQFSRDEVTTTVVAALTQAAANLHRAYRVYEARQRREDDECRP